MVEFEDRALGPQSIEPEDDPIVTRADGEAAYPLAVVMDDHRDGVTEVVRGADLLSATAVQIRLYEQLGVTPPTWLHTPMILGPDGKKLSKSHGSAEVRALRAAGVSAAQVWGRLRRLLGDPGDGPCRIEELVAGFMPGRVMRGPVVSTPERSDALLPP